MIVIVGNPAWRAAPVAAPAGRACSIALAAAARGARVELIGRVGEDPDGEALLIALAGAGVGHAAVLRDAARPTPVVASKAGPPTGDGDDPSPLGDPAGTSATTDVASRVGPRLDGADVDLGVKYLEPSGVMVVTDDASQDVLAACVVAAGYAEMRLVVLVAATETAASAVPATLPGDATVLAAPANGGDDDAGAFEAIVGAYAVELDRGADPAAAFAAAQGSTGWESAAAD